MTKKRPETPRGTTGLGRLFFILLAAAGAIQLIVIWSPGVPLGVPGEWTWPRIGYEAGDGLEMLLGLLVAAPVAIAYLWFCRFADPSAAGGAARVGWRLAGLVAAGFAWLWAVQEASPREYNRLGRAPLVIYYPSFSGYFTEARRVADLPGYLASYEGFVAQGDVLHLGTHPPGLIVAQRLLLDLFEASPALTRLTLSSRPASVRATTELIVETRRAGRPGDPPPTPADQAELWAAALLVQLAAAAAVIPLYHWTKGATSDGAAWRAACLWPLVPAVAVFLPKSDALLPLFGLGTLALWHASNGPGYRKAAAAGGVFWLGMSVSLAMLPVGLLSGLLTAQRIAREPTEKRAAAIRAAATATAVAAATFLALTLGVFLLFDLNLFAVWSWNYRNHAAFYSEYSRTYWRWLLINPAELAFALGLPAILAVSASSATWPRDARSGGVAVLCVAGLLWLSGKNSGEAARLWLFLMPWLLWSAARFWDGTEGRARWAAVLPVQMLVCFATAVRVSGFGFDEFPGASG